MWSGEGIPKGCNLLTGSEVEGWGGEEHAGGHWFAHLKMKEKALEPFFFFLKTALRKVIRPSKQTGYGSRIFFALYLIF